MELTQAERQTVRDMGGDLNPEEGTAQPGSGAGMRPTALREGDQVIAKRSAGLQRSLDVIASVLGAPGELPSGECQGSMMHSGEVPATTGRAVSSGRGLGPGGPVEEVSQAQIVQGVSTGLSGLMSSAEERVLVVRFESQQAGPCGVWAASVFEIPQHPRWIETPPGGGCIAEVAQGAGRGELWLLHCGSPAEGLSQERPVRPSSDPAMAMISCVKLGCEEKVRPESDHGLVPLEGCLLQGDACCQSRPGGRRLLPEALGEVPAAFGPLRPSSESADPPGYLPICFSAYLCPPTSLSVALPSHLFSGHAGSTIPPAGFLPVCRPVTDLLPARLPACWLPPCPPGWHIQGLRPSPALPPSPSTHLGAGPDCPAPDPGASPHCLGLGQREEWDSLKAS
ncbi:hypothetical protein Cadr_000013647 [Camelus dromedarius]|uniref:Uncharacterized protein n=1 Tax=Camelus dromedarius TaxID=9838 RepID=A0A5N4DBL4_CAMDR|nr:hypothetical protein Cadr_000013647 [Camelus dromedarius]